MGNSIGGRRTAKVMKIDGETLKLRTPVQAWEIVKDYPGHDLIEAEAVKNFGIRAKPLKPQQELRPKKLYFLIELPKLPQEKVPRKVRSGIHLSAKDRLESLMLSRRSASDLSIVKSTSLIHDESSAATGGGVSVRMRLPKSQVTKLVEESKDVSEAAEKLMSLCMANGNDVKGFEPQGNGGVLLHQQTHWKPGGGNIDERSLKTREKRVGFLPTKEFDQHGTNYQ